jgi:hypothetical protein
MNDGSRIFIAGHSGLVGAAIRRICEASDFRRLILKPHAELDLRDQAAVNSVFNAQESITCFSPPPESAAFMRMTRAPPISFATIF